MSSLTSRARGAVSRAADHPGLERLTRAGFIGYGVLHLLFAWVIARVATGGPTEDGDQSGAMQEIADEPVGLVLIVAIVVGLVAMALWQVLELLRQRRPTEWIASAGRAAFYLYLAFSGVKVLRGKKSSSADTQQDAAEGLLASSGGRLSVVAAGLLLAGIGGWLAVVGFTGRFEKHLRVGEMTAATRRLVRRLGGAGFVAKGLSYGIAGALFVVAAWRYDPDKARGLDAALRTLAGEAYGTGLLLVIAVGFAAYGLFAVTEARYRKV
ncbi:DUF1206 domain-containing protein [Micromonospora auratinigra]|uniref:DUF1206 domain-containing protein n=1 Tax=Micromonospora auratinigra TaxID=261654 RepID=A0A1A8Z5I5_9ACTN|nr:DUF1206 domain-containing protein [Micromonospora auratinigra]SBT39057.1 protein of unknown function (DUF1206) [Micromonospora auratinigra]